MLFSPEELKALEEASSHVVEIISFIPEKSVDPLYCHLAMADGLLAPQALVPDLDAGPRSIGEPDSTQEHASAPEKKGAGMLLTAGRAVRRPRLRPASPRSASDLRAGPGSPRRADARNAS